MPQTLWGIQILRRSKHMYLFANIRRFKLCFLFCIALAVNYLVYFFPVDKCHQPECHKVLWRLSPIRKEKTLSDPSSFLVPVEKLNLPSYKAKNVDCSGLYAGEKEAILQSQKRDKGPLDWIPKDGEFLKFHNLHQNCEKFLNENPYIRHTSVAEEIDFPLAFSILMFKSVSQFERLLRAVYRPWNYYCIHIDKKSPRHIFQSVRAILKCLPESNVLLLRERLDVQWGTFTVLEADLRCFSELLTKFPKWKYLINLTGQEFPLKTNLELVRILKVFNGANNLEGTYKRRNRDRLPTKTFPFRFTWYKGSVHIIASRPFIQFMLTDEKALTILDSLFDTWVADETYFSTLNHNPFSLNAPGSYLGEAETDQSNYPFIARLKNWGGYPFNYPCKSGMWKRGICIWGREDLPFINSRFELFINKLYWDFQSSTLDCLEERYFNLTKDDYDPRGPKLIRPYPLSFYKNLSFVKNHL